MCWGSVSYTHLDVYKRQVYGIFVGLFVYKEISLRKVIGLFKDNVAFIGGMMFTFAPAAALGSVFSYLGVQKAISSFFLGISTNPYIVLLFVFIILAIAGMFIPVSYTHLIVNRITYNMGLTTVDEQPVDGYLAVPNAPGLGNEISEQAYKQAEAFAVVE